VSVLRPMQSVPHGAVRLLALCGMTAPVLMLVLWTVASLMRPGYDQLSQYGSELGSGPSAIIMNTNFVVTGLLIVAFSTSAQCGRGHFFRGDRTRAPHGFLRFEPR